MKKLVLVSAVAAASLISVAANAGVTSSINSSLIQMYVSNQDMEYPCPSPYTTGLTLSGTAAAVSLDGHVCLDPYGDQSVLVAVDFDLDGAGNASGTVFDSGTVGVAVNIGTGWIPYPDIVATSTDPVNCVVGGVGHLGTNLTAGIDLSSGTHFLAGTWSGNPADSSVDNAACAVLGVMGQDAGLFLSGSVTVTP